MTLTKATRDRTKHSNITQLAIAAFLILAMAGAASAAGNTSIVVTDIDIDGSITSLAFSNITTLNPGDTATNDNIYGIIRFNLTNYTSQITPVRNNLTSVRLELYGASKTGSPTFDIRINYSYNDTWDNTLRARPAGAYNRSDVMTAQVWNNTLNMTFELKSAYLNDANNNNATIVLETTTGTDSDSVADWYLFNSSDALANRPRLVFVYDNTSYQNTHHRNYTEIDTPINDFDSEGFFIPIIFEANGKYYFVKDLDSQTDTIIYDGSTPPNFATLVSTTQTWNTTTLTGVTFNNASTNECYIYLNAARNLINCNEVYDKKYYRNTDITLNMFLSGSVPNTYSNMSPFHVGNGTYALGSENFYNLQSGFVKNTSYYPITRLHLFESENLYRNTSTSLGTEWTKVIRETWFVFNSTEAQGVFWNWQLGDTVLRKGSILLKGSDEYINFDENDMAGMFIGKNRTKYAGGTHNKLVPFNYTFYANASQGYLVMNLSLFAETSLWQHQVMNVSGTWTYSNGSTVSISDTLGFTELKMTRNWDYVDWISNGWLVDERIDADKYTSTLTDREMFNFTVRGNNTSNVNVGIYNTTKLYNSTQVKIYNNLSGLYNNMSVVGNGTYTIKSLNITLNSSAAINITVNAYNSSLITFTATNATADQTMNVTVYDDAFAVTNGTDYRIKKNGTVQQTTTASGNSVVFTNISVGSDYEIGAETHNVSGYVSNALGLILENARADIGSSYDFTDASGYYIIEDVNGGTHTVLVRAIGYRNATNTTEITGDTVINFTLNERVAGTVSAPNIGIIASIFIFISANILRRKKI